VVAEEFPERHVPIQRLVDVLEGAIVKRLVHGRDHGVALLAEGLLEKLDPQTLGSVERDAYGNVRLEELELARLLETRVAASLAARGIGTGIVAKDLGYELRCARRVGSTSSTAGASATGPHASCSTAAPKRWRRSRAAGWFQSPSGIYSTRRRARFAFATRTSTRRRTERSTLT
jgi:6-phosphofructokinase